MISVDTAVLGTDAWGVHLASELADSPMDTALVGPHHTREEYGSHLDRLSGFTQIEAPDTNPNKHENLTFRGGQLFDLQSAENGFHLALQTDGELTSVHASRIVVTAPPGPDLVNNDRLVPGTDSAVAGLLIDRFEIEFEGSTERWVDSEDGIDRLLGLPSGFNATDDGRTSEDGIFVFGLARSGQPQSPNFTIPDFLTEPAGLVNEPGDVPGEFTWQDESMPEGFVDTKTRRLRELMQRVLIDEPPADTEPLVQEIEGLAGEIDSYSRFRTEPGLRRLRWKMLTAMNLIRPYLVESSSAVG